ncbi:hypothetical protein JP75_07890 [Devosia riboflavina]|uniref:Uncharacterized protein n=1 Tax=Devosia riboflavina TaxID=46914 RepID=A0A087M3K8_9HYPH|nr:hypothetical protein JP75_07890 [Devosia riboflavina]
MDERSSEELHWQLMREGMRPAAVGAAKASNDLASAPVYGEEDRKRRHSPSGRRDSPKLKPRVRPIWGLPGWFIIDGGKS